MGRVAATAYRAARHTAAMASGPPENDPANAADAAAALAAVCYRELMFWMFQVVFWTWVGLAAIVDVVSEQGWVKIVIRLPAGGVPVDKAIPTVIKS